MNRFGPINFNFSRKDILENSTTNFCPIIKAHNGEAATYSSKPTQPPFKTNNNKSIKMKNSNFIPAKPAENGQLDKVLFKHLINEVRYTKIKKI
ncbi:hypothetical protein AYI70_g6116 [Smittium culicis]|uniref:Uncharacterized protein n=1 Tax=Smittium culicis TaxID=133412 RepID=A0A1R1XRG9_9FUNG|nr:hypothetical protein AYI70_g6116 [Smittium culicis]